jgi:hypothetical protein
VNASPQNLTYLMLRLSSRTGRSVGNRKGLDWGTVLGLSEVLHHADLEEFEVLDLNDQ